MSKHELPDSRREVRPDSRMTGGRRGDDAEAIPFNSDIASARRWLEVKRCVALANIAMAVNSLHRLRRDGPDSRVDALVEDLHDARRQIEALDPSALSNGKALNDISERLKTRLEAF